jgi:predicted DCC family thiol-disulfide oxidoreductase YuxK
MAEHNKPILFFDGHCNLCNGVVDFLVRHDKACKILLAPLQGETARKTLPAGVIAKLSTVVLYDTGGEIYMKSSAVFRVAWIMGGWFHLITPFWIVPRLFTNWIYDFVALARYPLFGRRNTCRLPTPEEQQHFLD